jgi:tRNA-splicing ligase RtcB
MISHENYDWRSHPQAKKISAWTTGVPVEAEAIQQIANIASLPFVEPHVAVMPDVHVGIGATVGSVIPTQGAIIPAAVGVDLGCGMMAKRLGVHIDDIKDLPKLRSAIERSVPVGRNQHSTNAFSDAQIESFGKITILPNYLEHKTQETTKARLQIGTLGGGNHFIELCRDQHNMAWVLLHSGSRYVGKRIADFYINKAKGICKEYFISLPDPDLAYLVESTQDFKDYIQAVLWAQHYAEFNRITMMRLILDDISYHMYKHKCMFELSGTEINCHHNYTQKENHFGKNLWITRKGAVSAKNDQLGIIPGSMGDRSYIVSGKGHPGSFCSCSHGAGRRMSRTKARETYTEADHISATDGVECKKDLSVIDETPGAYKNIESVMEAQKDLVNVLFTLKQVLCVKG